MGERSFGFLRPRLYSQAVRKAKWEASSLRYAFPGGERTLRGFAGQNPEESALMDELRMPTPCRHLTIFSN